MCYKILNVKPFGKKLKWYFVNKDHVKFSYVTDLPFKDYCFMSESELEVFKKYDLEIEYSEQPNAVFERYEKSHEKVFKVEFPVVYQKAKYLEKMELEEGILIDEADVNYVERVFIDLNIKELVDIVDDKVVPVEGESFPLKVCWADYETDDRPEILKLSEMDSFAKPDVARIISCSIADGETGEITHFCHDSERVLLKQIAKHFEKYDVIVFWNGVEFDEKFDKRFKMHRIVYNPDLYIRLDYMRIFEMLNPKERQFLSLDVTAFRHLNIRKIKHKWTFYEAFENHREELKIYNNRDVEIMYKLDEKFNYIDLILNSATDVGFLPQRYTYARYATIPYIYRISANHFDKRIVWKSKSMIPETRSFEGAIVFDTVKGVHKNVIGVDLRSLYNSVIQTYNISPEQLVLHEDGTHTYDRYDHLGIMPLALQKFEQSRNIAKKARDAEKNPKKWKFLHSLQAGLKIRLLAIYGGLGARGAKKIKEGEKPSGAKSFYNYYCASDTTKYSREIIMMAVKVAKDMGYTLVAGDTDSIYVSIGEKDFEIDEVKQIMKNLVTNINKAYENMLEDRHIPSERRKIFMEAQGYYSPFVLFGKKKYYFAREVWNAENDKVNDELNMYAKGVKYIKYSEPLFVRNFQEEVYKKILLGKSKSEVVDYISKVKDEFDNGQHDKDLVFEVKLSRPLSEYSNITGHLKLAERLIKSGKMQEKSALQYVITDVDFGNKPIMDVEGSKITNVGRNYFWKHRVQKWIDEIIDVAFYTQFSLDNWI